MPAADGLCVLFACACRFAAETQHHASDCWVKIRAFTITVYLIAGTFSATKTTSGKIVDEEGDVTLAVFCYHDGRAKPHKIKFKEDGVFSKLKFNVEGLVKIITVGSEKYKVVYDAEGTLVKVKVTFSGSTRYLEEEENNDAEQITPHGTLGGRRRLYDCTDCYRTWDVVCGIGHNSECDLVSLDTDRLRNAALGAICTMCDSFELFLRSTLNRYAACEGQCECTPALQIALE